MIIHPLVKRQLQAVIANPPHALLIVGPEGAGKGTIATYIVSELLGTTPAGEIHQAYFKRIEPTGTSIPIEAIRDLQQFTRLRTTGKGNIRRAVIIEQGHLLTTEAQNAFLKLLEEPPADTIIILTVVGEQALLPTIYSRAQQLQLRPPDLEAAASYFEKHDQAAIQKAYFMSSGQPGLMSALLNEEEHPLVASINDAKQLLTQSKYERLCRIDALAKQKEQLPQLLAALQRVCQAALKQASEKQSDIRKWHSMLKHIQRAQDALTRNAQPKLLLTDLFLAL
jgi:DNA polymerase III delta prime subunit